MMKDYSDEIITYVENQSIDTFMEGEELKEYIVEQLIRDNKVSILIIRI